MRIKINRNLTPEEEKKLLEQFENSILTPAEEKEAENAIRRGEYLKGIILPDGTATTMGDR